MSKDKELEKHQNTVHAVPPCDIMEQNGSVRILLDLPGIHADALNIDVKDRQLRVTASLPELWQGRKVDFRRNFQLSEDIDTGKISAKIKNGVLELVLPKLESAMVHKINIARE